MNWTKGLAVIIQIIWMFYAAFLIFAHPEWPPFVRGFFLIIVIGTYNHIMNRGDNY